ncbi:TPA: DUF1273 family protein, partial [Streptococcus pyogenes]|nr:DUF1273 family protein [Streptococcus pyogenes]
KYYFPNYEQPPQFSQYYQFLLEKTEGAYVFYDTENETNLKYFLKKAKDMPYYQLLLLTFDRLNDMSQS